MYSNGPLMISLTRRIGKLFVIRSPVALRYYSKFPLSYGNLPNLPFNSKGIIYENPLNKDKYIIVYEDFLSMKRIIIEENRGKSGIYLITNKQTSDFYIGQAGDISKRYVDYLNLVTLNG